MNSNIYKNQTHLNDVNNGASFVCPMKEAENCGDGFCKYNKYKSKNN